MQSISIDGSNTNIEIALKGQDFQNRQRVQKVEDDGFSDLNSRAESELDQREESAMGKPYGAFGAKQSLPVSEMDFDRESE